MMVNPSVGTEPMCSQGTGASQGQYSGSTAAVTSWPGMEAQDSGAHEWADLAGQEGAGGSYLMGTLLLSAPSNIAPPAKPVCHQPEAINHVMAPAKPGRPEPQAVRPAAAAAIEHPLAADSCFLSAHQAAKQQPPVQAVACLSMHPTALLKAATATADTAGGHTHGSCGHTFGHTFSARNGCALGAAAAGGGPAACGRHPGVAAAATDGHNAAGVGSAAATSGGTWSDGVHARAAEPTLVGSAALHVRNLPLGADEVYLHKAFSPFGALTCCKVFEEPGTGRPMGFVGFLYDECALQALHNIHGAKNPDGSVVWITLQASQKVCAAAAALMEPSRPQRQVRLPPRAVASFAVVPRPQPCLQATRNAPAKARSYGAAGPWQAAAAGAAAPQQAAALTGYQAVAGAAMPQQAGAVTGHQAGAAAAAAAQHRQGAWQAAAPAQAAAVTGYQVATISHGQAAAAAGVPQQVAAVTGYRAGTSGHGQACAEFSAGAGAGTSVQQSQAAAGALGHTPALTGYGAGTTPQHQQCAWQATAPQQAGAPAGHHAPATLQDQPATANLPSPAASAAQQWQVASMQPPRQFTATTSFLWPLQHANFTGHLAPGTQHQPTQL